MFHDVRARIDRDRIAAHRVRSVSKVLAALLLLDVVTRLHVACGPGYLGC